MEHNVYRSRVEEALSIKQRSRKDQVRLMLLFKEADNNGCLIQFCTDIGYTEAGASNYLLAYDRFVTLGVLPADLPNADINVPESIPAMWGEAFDPTSDGRFGYGSVDRQGVENEAERMGLKGSTKALDIAKNPRSMTAAILGDHRAAQAALEAILTLARRDPLIAHGLRQRTPPMPPPQRPLREDPADVLRSVLHGVDFAVERLADFDVPEGMESLVIEHVAESIRSLSDLRTVLEGRRALNRL